MRAWLSDQLQEAAFTVQVLPTGGHPIVLAKNKHVPGRQDRSDLRALRCATARAAGALDQPGV
jgi:hypothetical protein